VQHQVIYQVIRDLHDLGEAVDVITLADELIRRDQYQEVGGDETLREIVDSVPHAANGRYYATIVRKKSIARQLIDGATQIIREAYSPQYTAQDLLGRAERKIHGIAQDQGQRSTMRLVDMAAQAMDQISARAESGGHAVTGIGTGFVDLDDLTGGLQAGQLIVLGSRPGMGKTALALNICDHVAVDLKVPVLFISLAEGASEITERLLRARSRVDGHKMRTGKGLGPREMAPLAKAYQALVASDRIFLDDTPDRDMLPITAVARRCRFQEQIGLIVVDYIQLVEPEDTRGTRQDQVARISRWLKILARKLEIPVIALSQLSRTVESREDRRPWMTDLRESGSLEEDADVVLLLHRPDYYDANDQPGLAELIVAKNRNGSTGSIKLAFIRNLTQFENLAPTAEPTPGGISSNSPARN
jgi:replicative DNA helicase